MSIYTSLRSNLYLAKQSILHRLNPKRCNYFLAQKTENLSAEPLKKVNLQVPSQADTYTVVTICKKNDKLYKKKITTYYTEGNIIKRMIEDSDGNNIIREYENSGIGLKKCTFFERKITNKVQNKASSLFETNLIKLIKGYRSEKDGKIKMQLFTNEIDGNSVNSTVTELPFSGKNNKFVKRKILGLKMDFIDGIPVIRETFESANVKFPSNDKYLPYRFIIDDYIKLKSLTKHFINKKNLDKLNIKISVSDKISDNTAGYFSENLGAIVYNKNSNTNLVKLASHEVEHAYQYKQIGRIYKGNSKYCRDSRKLYGPIDGINESMEAHKYAVASEKYPNIDKSEDLSKNPEYVNNYLEVKAREAEDAAFDEYKSMGEDLNSQFFFGLE